MENLLQRGLTHEFKFKVPENKTVPYLSKIFLGTVKYQIKSSEKEEIVCLG